MLDFADRVGWKLQKRDDHLVTEFCNSNGVEKHSFKVWLYNNKKHSSFSKTDNNEQPTDIPVATADILHDVLIHKIVSYLSYKEAAQMAVLSKTWLQAWLTHPNLVFYVDSDQAINRVDKVMERYKTTKIPIHKFNLRALCTRDDEFEDCLLDKWLEIALQSDMKHISCSYDEWIDYTFPISKILSAKYLRELELEGCWVMPGSLSGCGAAKCNSLRKLSLNKVSLDENTLQALLNSCPLIVSFNLEYCNGFGNIELQNLQKIESISIRSSKGRNTLVEIQASCPNLKSLEISYGSISVAFIEHVVPGFLSLKSLTLQGLHIEKSKLRSQSLKELNISTCYEAIMEIDAPNLVSLKYEGVRIPEFKIAKMSHQMRHSTIDLRCRENLNTAWFCKLRKFLSNLTSWSEISLSFSGCNKINRKDLQLQHRVAASQVDVLNVEISSKSLRECPMLVDALLWSCLPRTINLKSTIHIISGFIDHLMYLKNLTRSLNESRHWHSQLKEVNICKLDKKKHSWQPVELTSGKLEIRPSRTRRMEKYSFLLDW